jgi:hypothetical protein
MLQKTLSLALGVALGCAVATAQDVILLDTYQDDTIGLPPNGPEIGSYIQLVGNHEVDDFGGGDKKVLSFSTSSDGYLINMRPVAEPPVVTTTYEHLIFGNSILSGINAVGQQWVLRPIGNNLSLWWGSDQTLRIRINYAGGSDKTINTGVSWNFDTEYDVSMLTDANADTFTLRINGSDVLVNEPFGADFTHIYSLAFSDTLTSSTQRVLNDVRMVNEACADESSPPLAELTTPPHLGTGCTCEDADIMGTADDPEVGLGSYTLEFRPASGGTWQEITTGNSAVSNGLLGTWSTGSVSEGIYNIRLTVTNACGLSSSTVRTIFLDKNFSNLELRSPNANAVVGRRVCFDGTVFDSWCFDQYVAEYRPASGGAWQPVDPSIPVYTSTVVNDPFATWDTTALGVADGDYDLRVRAETDCGNTARTMRTVTVDNTPPDAAIANINNCDQLDGVVTIRGTAADMHLAGWSLQYLGGDTTSWVTIATGNGSVVNDVLATWDTTDLRPCPYVIRLTVSDESILNCDADNRHVRRVYRTVLVGGLDFLRADMNCDGVVDFFDIDPFVDCLINGDCDCP